MSTSIAIGVATVTKADPKRSPEEDNKNEGSMSTGHSVTDGMTSLNVTHPADFLLSWVTGCVGAIGAPGNLFLMILIASEYQKRKPHDWLFFLLALGDFLLCINNAALEAPFVLRPARIECKFAAAFDYILGMMSFLTPPLVAYNRYVSLYNNARYQKLFTNRNVFIAWAMTAVIASSWVSTFALMDSLGQDDVGLCGLQMNNNFLRASMAFGCVLVMTAYSLLVYYAYKVVMKIREHRKGAARSRLQSRLLNESQEIITALIFSSGVPFFAQIPIAVVKLLQAILPPFDPWIGRASAAPFPLTSAVNAYVTIFVVKEYRKKVTRIFNNVVSVAPAATTEGPGRPSVNAKSEIAAVRRGYIGPNKRTV